MMAMMWMCVFEDPFFNLVDFCEHIFEIWTVNWIPVQAFLYEILEFEAFPASWNWKAVILVFSNLFNHGFEIHFSIGNLLMHDLPYKPAHTKVKSQRNKRQSLFQTCLL